MKGLSFQDHSPAFARALSKLSRFPYSSGAPKARVRAFTSPLFIA